MSTENQELIRVIGTTPLSFECTKVGDILEVRPLGAPAKNRPTAGGKFTGTAYLVFKDKTKVGRLDDKELGNRAGPTLKTCTIILHDQEQNVLRVSLK